MEGKPVKADDTSPLPEGVPEGKARGTPESKGLYMTAYPELSPNVDSI